MPDRKDTDPENADVVEKPEEQSEAEQPLEDEEHTTSLPAQVLKVLFLVALGCGIGLWGAPKLAPLLPTGMAPVAEFLMPGQSVAKAEVIALRAEVKAKIAELEARPTSNITQEDIDQAIAAYDANNAKVLGALKDQISATDGQDIESRLATVETRLQGATAELAAISERLSLQVTENGAALSEEAVGKLSGYQAVIDGLKAQLDGLAAKQGTLNQRIDEVSSASARRVEEASTKAASSAATKLVSDINSALDSGASFQAALDGLAKIAQIEPPLELSGIAATGTASWANLRGQFSEVAHTALRADTQANASDGAVGKFGAFLRTQVGTRSLQRREGNDANAILSRVEDELIRGNLSKALGESENLGDAPKEAMKDWLAALDRLSAAHTAMAQIISTLGVAK
ncbi:MAG: hypothetical protein KUG74_08335 [Rhodobacteraceae bacterium]|nr:hypothetical protein [Paracoccaceae bacterium]